jgi:predicted nucleic acid-binding protein
VTVVSDSSPLITLAKIGRLELLHRLYRTMLITPQVYGEVVMVGAERAGSVEVSASQWIEVKAIRNLEVLTAARENFGLGIGETSAIILGAEVNADIVLIDEIKARKVARGQGLAVLGCVGVLEDAYNSRLLSDLTQAYRQLVAVGAYVDRRILENSLKMLDLPSL